ncbi:MAG: hypothetical protein KAJ07_11620 [Planctomycetes bacterium]|nr:hypothetical protein [Planctomycetota bacterium]
MYQKTQGVKTDKPFSFPTRGVIQEPQLGILTEAYAIGESEYFLLKQWNWADWLYLIACASLGICLEQLYKFVIFMWKAYTGNPEEIQQLVEGQDYNGDKSLLIWAGIISGALFIINRFIPTKKKKLLKEISSVLHNNRSVIATKKKGKNCE